LALVLVSAWAVGCGGAGTGPSDTYAASATASAMRAAGWQVSVAEGMPQTVTGTEQVAYLQASTSAGHRIDVQFLTGPAQAKSEGDAAEKQLQGFRAVVLGNVLAFTPPSGRAPIAAADREALGKLLRP
jgi:hypothetical protein